MKKKIVIEIIEQSGSGCWGARLKNDPSKRSSGTTSAEAIGMLILEHKLHFEFSESGGIHIERIY